MNAITDTPAAEATRAQSWDEPAGLRQRLRGLAGPRLRKAEGRVARQTQGDAIEAEGPPTRDLQPDVADTWTDRPEPILPDGHGRQDGSRGSFFGRKPLTFAAALLAFGVAAGSGYLYWDYAGHFESTDDAFIAARQFSIAPKVSGYIVAVPVTDNQQVAAGAVIARIDDRDYRIALEQAQAQVAAAQASITTIDAQIAIQQSKIAASQASVTQAQAALTFAGQQAARYKDLARLGAGTLQMAQQTASGLQQQQAALENARSALTAAQGQIGMLTAQRAGAEANLASARAQRDQARLNLSYTVVTAAQPGRVVNLSAAVGEFAQPGTSIAMFVPDKTWVTANFKETQLAEMRPGQPVTLRIDAYPGKAISGHVASVQPGSGTAFSLLPAENATGNYVKVVQRVPVKIVMDDPPADVAIGPGMSVLPTVRVEPAPSLYERLARWLGRVA